MIQSHDRSGWFGASDVEKIVGKWGSSSWVNWWLEKLAIRRNDFATDAMMAGTYWEHKILEGLGFPLELDKQIVVPELHLRVNLDGNNETTIYECKTYQFDKGFKVPPRYVHQVLVQMYAAGLRNAFIVSYGLVPDDMKNYFRPLEKCRISLHKIEYDGDWVCGVFLPKLNILSDCLERGVIPDGI